MIAAGLATVWLAVGDPLGPSDVDADQARDRACDVTARGGICNPSEPEEPDLPEAPDTPDLPNPGGVGFIGQLVVIVLVALLVIAIAWLVMRWLDGSSGGNSGGEDGELGDLDEAIDELVDARIVDHETPPDRWRRLAAQARDAGEHREAIRCQYRALVGDLARSGYVDEIPGRTSGEERKQVSEIAPRLGEVGRDVARQFDLAADTFDEAWFDDRPVTATDDERFLAAERGVLDVVLTGTGKRAARRNDRDSGDQGAVLL